MRRALCDVFDAPLVGKSLPIVRCDLRQQAMHPSDATNCIFVSSLWVIERAFSLFMMPKNAAEVMRVSVPALAGRR